jgi:hypothetical protein
MKPITYIGAIGYGAYYLFGYVIDPSGISLQGWAILTCVTVVIVIAAAHFSPSRLLGILWRTATIRRQQPMRNVSTQHSQSSAMPKPSGNGAMDYFRAQVVDAKRKLIEVQTEEARKTAETKRQAMMQAEERKAADHAARLAMRKPVVADAPAIVLPRMTLKEAIAQSTERSWVMGQESAIQGDGKYKPTGKLLTFDYRTNHIAIVGATGSGKTESTAELLVYYARRFNLHVIILDGKNGLDWQRFDGAVEWHSATLDSIEHLLDGLTNVFQRRWDAMREAEVNKVYDLPGKPPRPVLVIFEEFGYLWSLIKQNKKLAAKLGKQVDDLFRLGRAAGIVMCLMDQAPEDWSSQMRNNAKFVICYKLNSGAGNTFNEYYAGKLPTAGVFTQANVFYDAWWFDNEMDLKRHCARQTKRYISEFARECGNDKGMIVPDSFTPVGNDGNGGNGGNETGGDGENRWDFRAIPPSLARSRSHSQSWDDFCKGYFELYQDATQAELRMAMAHVDGTGRKATDFGGEAFRQYHRWSINGNPVKSRREKVQ